MSLSYHFTFSAPATIRAAALEQFLGQAEQDARTLGFHPTLVLNATFETAEQKQFARRLTSGLRVEDERLKRVTLLDPSSVWSFDPEHGSCRLIPIQAVVLIVTDEQHRETVFGFMRYPDHLTGINGEPLIETPTAGRWFHRNFVDSPDDRFRRIVRKFDEAGFLEEERDEFAAIRQRKGPGAAA
jgi:hypothetical protein